MPIARISEFAASLNHGDALHARLQHLATMLRPAPGCLTVTVLRRLDDPGRVVLYEVWESMEHHKVATNAVPTGVIRETVALLTSPPAAKYFTLD